MQVYSLQQEPYRVILYSQHNVNLRNDRVLFQVLGRFNHKFGI